MERKHYKGCNLVECWCAYIVVHDCARWERSEAFNVHCPFTFSCKPIEILNDGVRNRSNCCEGCSLSGIVYEKWRWEQFDHEAGRDGIYKQRLDSRQYSTRDSEAEEWDECLHFDRSSSKLEFKCRMFLFWQPAYFLEGSDNHLTALGTNVAINNVQRMQ